SDALPLAQRLFGVTQNIHFTPNHASLHQLVNSETGITIDQAIVTYFKAPHSFTGEDVVELSCHGSPVVLAEVLRMLCSFGAELAQPGEFSLRAFLNQRIDLTQAEAINDLIHAQTTYQARVAARQLCGELSRQLKPIKDGLVELIVHFESSVEFVEDDLDPINLKLFLARIDRYIEQLSQLSSSYRLGRFVRIGIKLALIGSPNVGKSSVFNALLGKERAIVTSIPGTTRDTLNDSFSINGIPVELVDTAGIRETEDVVEKMGVERTKAAISDADLTIAVIEANSPVAVEEKALFDQIPINLIVANKSDLGIHFSEEAKSFLAETAPTIYTSALTGEGIEELKQSIYRQLISESQRSSENAIITNERHYQALEYSLDSLRQAKCDLASGFTEEVALANLHQSLKSLGVITGETLIADIINQIFSTFCIGK
ncbi:MAG: tRNA uridine-5-carboxymethylaminomethyl(34) synthesis GTPase MnmE, partial [Leptolyngbyaceae cyanobacterium CAN_BIN12]|nr:tRNA uridine-5-carboxymethylaminomethyl(34) synthesis GTPase MnmE [Leptolyngbyaceae cyanobacterium CAN_BIN12]